MFLVYAYAINDAFTIGVFDSNAEVDKALSDLLYEAPTLFEHYLLKVEPVELNSNYALEYARRFNTNT